MKTRRYFIFHLISLLGVLKLSAGDEFPSRFLELLNQERKTHHLPPLQPSSFLEKLAQTWSEGLADQQRLRHRSGSELIEILKKNGWKRLNENLHTSPEGNDPAHVLRSWMNSPVHRRNCLDPQMTHIGIGSASSPDGKTYVVMNAAAL